MASKVSLGGSNYPSSHLDGRNDLGYGLSSPKFTGDQRSLGSNVYPYNEADTEIDSEVEDEIDADTWNAVHSKLYEPHQGDGHFDPFTFVGGNRKLSEALGFSSSQDISPIRGLYKNRSAAVGTKSGTARGDGSTNSPKFDKGDRWGWSAPLYQNDDSNDENWTLEDIAQKQIEESILRFYIRKLLLSRNYV